MAREVDIKDILPKFDLLSIDTETTAEETFDKHVSMLHPTNKHQNVCSKSDASIKIANYGKPANNDESFLKVTSNRAVSMETAIRRSFTTILKKLDPMKLCDHMYEKGMIRFEFYKEMLDRIHDKQMTENTARFLLVRLSQTRVDKAEMSEVLVKSGHSELVPLFLPPDTEE
ncbi:hypothetical protein DPMN_190011 [Dreissena polymorpha]|uniref:Uncharacterized protein n=1 Tax=Dreissena polymorpha TaxID=45954 RepID=A0A9D4IBC4_DREPO|nr:hypothetical protein DPMN_190011 [Dreissena polymorpha]